MTTDNIIKRYIQFSLISLATPVPFALLTLPLMFRKFDYTKIPTFIYYYIVFWFLFYLSGAIHYIDLTLAVIAAIILILPIFLYLNIDKSIFKPLFFALLIFEVWLIYDYTAHFILYSEVKRIHGLSYNGFYAAQTAIYLNIILVYHNYLKSIKYKLLGGFAIGLTLTRSSLILIAFVKGRKFYLLAFIFAFLLTFILDFDITESRFTVEQTTTNRLETITTHSYHLTTGTGLNQAYTATTLKQNPHNIFYSAAAQLSILGSIPIIILLYGGYLIYGYKYGFWKIIPPIIYDQIDGSILTNYIVVAITIIYYFFMAKRPIFMDNK